MRLLVIAVGLLVAQIAIVSAEEPRMPVTAEDLSSIEQVPFGKEGAAGSPEFHAIVREGLTIIPELADLLDDATPTQNRVPLWGGFYAVGDVAMSAISDIVMVPWLEFITTPDDPRIEAIGFGVYWTFVRESPENRAQIKSKFLDWYRENEKQLVWRSIPNIMDGGIYELPPKSNAADG